MNCERFERWLDSGTPDSDAAAARMHARDCESCAAALEAWLELDVALDVVAAAPAGFTDRVMARVAESPQPLAGAARLPVAASLPPSPFPWWVSAMMQPAAVLAAVAAALLAGFGEPMLRGVFAAQGWAAQALAGHAPAALDPVAARVVALALLPSVAWMSWRIYRWSEGLAARGAWRNSQA